MIRWPRAGSLVLVRWDDAHQQVPRGTRHEPAEPATDDPVTVETVGWLRRTARYVYLYPERCPSDVVPRYRGATRIPRGMVREVVRIAGP